MSLLYYLERIPPSPHNNHIIKKKTRDYKVANMTAAALFYCMYVAVIQFILNSADK